MFSKLSNSWELVKASAAVLRSDKELVVFPIVSAVGSLIVLATFAIPMFLAGVFDQMSVDGKGFQPLGMLIAFLFYLVQYSVIFFCNTALVGAALIRLRGGDPTVADGFRIASQRLGPILGYALISATVGMILRAISERAGLIGRIVISLIGFAWTVATYLVVPVLAAEEIGPLDAVKRSAQLLKRTWGEQLVGNAGVNAVFGLMLFGIFLVGVPLIVLAALSNSVALMVVVIALLVLAALALGVISSTLSGIYSAAVYRYAAEGEIGGEFSAKMVQSAFRPKN
ncbi:MAG TPA: DUF6159 family protein [Roseiflexaceae bacterium]|nr:DUF6159 family protein [Roseiflexaceae bacterium]